MTVHDLIKQLTAVSATFPAARVKAQGWNDSGDLMDIDLRGDVRVERDVVGNPIVCLR